MTPYEECWDALHSYLHELMRKYISWNNHIHQYEIQGILHKMSDIENEIIGEMEE